MKRIIFGVTIMMSLLTSAFVNKATDDIYAQTSPGNYEYVNYNDGQCFNQSQYPCAYVITLAGHNAEIEANAPFDLSEIEEYTNRLNPYLHAIGENKIFIQD